VLASLLSALRRWFPPLRVRPKLIGSVVALGVYGLIVHVAVTLEHLPHLDWGAESTAFSGLVLGFLIAFRNRQAYDRWWEARKLWGQLINESRILCLKLRSLDPIEPAERQAVGRLVIAYAAALLEHLRRRDGPDEDRSAQAVTETGGAPVHRPIRVAGEIYQAVMQWQRDGRLDGWRLLWLDRQLNSLMDVCGACERIRNTPLSSSYRALLRQGIAIYLAAAPFYLIEDVGLAGFPVFVLAAYFLLGIEMVAEEIEEPFGVGGDDLPLERYCAAIDSSTREILGI
jgi:putative membrane protein